MPFADYKITYINETPLGVFVGARFFSGEYVSEADPVTNEEVSVYKRTGEIHAEEFAFEAGTDNGVITSFLNSTLSSMEYEPIPEQQ